MILLGEDRGWERVARRVSVDYFPARHGGSLQDYDGEDGEHGLLAASEISFHRLHVYSIQVFVVIANGNLGLASYFLIDDFTRLTA